MCMCCSTKITNKNIYKMDTVVHTHLEVCLTSRSLRGRTFPSRCVQRQPLRSNDSFMGHTQDKIEDVRYKKQNQEAFVLKWVWAASAPSAPWLIINTAISDPLITTAVFNPQWSILSLTNCSVSVVWIPPRLKLFSDPQWVYPLI